MPLNVGFVPQKWHWEHISSIIPFSLSISFHPCHTRISLSVCHVVYRSQLTSSLNSALKKTMFEEESYTEIFFCRNTNECGKGYFSPDVYLKINQRDALNFTRIMSLFHVSTYFEHICSSSGGENCTIQPLVSSQL